MHGYIDDDTKLELKRTYPDIFSIVNGGNEYIFRSLTGREFSEIVDSDINSADQEEYIVNAGVVWPEYFDVNKEKPGFISGLAEEIINVSGFIDIDFTRNLLDERREKLSNDIRVTAKSFILAAMPIYKEEDLDELTFMQLVDKVIYAEEIFKIQQAVAGFEEPGGIKLTVSSPEEEQELTQDEQNQFNMARKPGTATAQDPIAAQLHEKLQEV